MSRDRGGRRPGAPARRADLPRGASPPPAPAPPSGTGALELKHKDWTLILPVALAHLASFITKPAHMDDTLYLATVRGILEDPLRPLTNFYPWEVGPRPIYTFAVNPPLYNYQQAALVAVFGWHLPLLHLLAAGYVLLAAVAMMALARRFTAWPRAAFLLLMLSPTLAPGTNLMLDVPGMELVLAALAAWIRGIDARSRRWLATAAGLAALALLTKYNSAIVLALMVLYALLRGRSRALAWLGVPVAGLGLWVLHNHFFMPGGAIHLLQSRERARPGGLIDPPQALHAIATWGSSFVFLPALAIPSWARGRGRALLAFAIPAGVVLIADVALALGGAPPWAAARSPEQVVFVVNGLLLATFIGVATARVWQRRSWDSPAIRDDAFLLAWPLAITAFNVLFAPHHAPRYYYPAFAALPLLLIRTQPRGAGARGAVWASIVAQATLALMLVLSDNAYARAERDFADRLAVIAGQRRETVAYVGHWGFQYAADQHPDLRCLDPRLPPPPPGVVIAVNLDTYEWEYPDWLRGLRPTRDPGIVASAFPGPDGHMASLRFRMLEPEWSAPHPGPLRTVSHGDGVLLYAAGTLVPYGRGAGPFHPTLVLETIP